MQIKVPVLYLRPEFMMKKTIWFVFLLVTGISCLDEPACYSLNNNIIGIAFKKLSDNKADTLFFYTITAEGTDKAFGNDVLLTGIDKLPLNFYQNETVFHFEGLDKVYDLQLGYSAKSQFVSQECGERFVLTKLKALVYSFDSIRVINPTPKRGDGGGTHLEIYRCPNTSRVKIKFSTAVTISSITTLGYEGAVLFSSAPATTVNVPLNTADQTSTIEFVIGGVTKTLTIGYQRKQQTLFSTCGPQEVLSDFEVISTTFSSATVIRKTIQDPPQTNLEITL